MSKEVISIRLTTKQIELINNQSDKLGVTFSETVRAIINKYYKLN